MSATQRKESNLYGIWTVVILAGRSVFPIAAILLLLFGAEPPSVAREWDVFFFAGILIAYFFVGVFLVARYFPRLYRGKSTEILVYFYDLGLHVVLIIGIYALIYRFLGLTEAGVRVEHPLDFLYFSIVTWTTLGYGDIVPSHTSRMFAASEALFGYVFMGLYLALIFHVISSRDRQPVTLPTTPPAPPSSPPGSA